MLCISRLIILNISKNKTNMYSVIQFCEKDGGTVTIINNQWFTPRRCEVFWPPVKGTKAFERVLADSKTPDEKWKLYSVQRVFCETDVKESILKDYNVLPLLEERVLDYIYVRHYSLQSNRLLASRWRELLKTLEVVKTGRTPFLFPKATDYHFYLHDTRYEPSQTLRNHPHFRRRMRNGPGVDAHGQTPIPNEMHVRKTDLTKRKKQHG